MNAWSSPSKQCHGIFSNTTQPKVLLLDCFNKVGHLIILPHPLAIAMKTNQYWRHWWVLSYQINPSYFLPNQPCKALLGIFFGTKFGPPQDCYLFFGNIYPFFRVQQCWFSLATTLLRFADNTFRFPRHFQFTLAIFSICRNFTAKFWPQDHH